MNKTTLKTFLAVTALVASSIGVAATTPKTVSYNFAILRVVDGDTVEIAAPYLPAPLQPKLSLRVYGVDTPEKGFRAECAGEAALGEAATAFTKSVIEAGTYKRIDLMKWDKYGGRILGDVNIDGRSLRQLLIERGFAREYYGDAKTSWCTK